MVSFKDMKKIFFYLIIGMFCVSCYETKTPNVLHSIAISTLDSDTSDLSSLVDSVYLVPLDIRDNIFVGSIRKMIVVENRIIILDGVDKTMPVKVFSKNGKYLYSINKGMGPGQLSAAVDMQYDVHSNKLIVFDGISLSFFYLDGSFVDRKYLTFPASNFCPLKDRFLFFIRPGLHNYRFLLTDNEFNEIDSFIPTNYKYSLSNYFENRFMPTSIDTINICIDTDTIYSYSNGIVYANYVFDYLPKLSETDRFSSFEDFVSASRKTNAFYFCGYYLENDLHISLLLNNAFKEIAKYVFVCKRTGHIKVSNRLSVFDDYGSNFGIPLSITDDNFFVSEYFGNNGGDYRESRFFSVDQNSLLRHYSREEGNPILLFYKLKDF